LELKHGNGLKRLQICNARFLRSVNGITGGRLQSRGARGERKYKFYIKYCRNQDYTQLCYMNGQ